MAEPSRSAEESGGLLRRLLEAQIAANHELNEQRIALGLPQKQFVAPELRAAVMRLDAAEASRPLPGPEPPASRREQPAETGRDADARANSQQEQERRGEDEQDS